MLFSEKSCQQGSNSREVWKTGCHRYDCPVFLETERHNDGLDWIHGIISLEYYPKVSIRISYAFSCLLWMAHMHKIEFMHPSIGRESACTSPNPGLLFFGGIHLTSSFIPYSTCIKKNTIFITTTSYFTYERQRARMAAHFMVLLQSAIK